MKKKDSRGKQEKKKTDRSKKERSESIEILTNCQATAEIDDTNNYLPPIFRRESKFFRARLSKLPVSHQLRVSLLHLMR